MSVMPTEVSDAEQPGRQRLAPKWDSFDCFNADQVAEILGLHRNSVYAALNAGTIPCLEIGRRKIVGRAVLERLLGYR